MTTAARGAPPPRLVHALESTCLRCGEAYHHGTVQRAVRGTRPDECPRCFYNRISSLPEEPLGQQMTILEEVKA